MEDPFILEPDVMLESLSPYGYESCLGYTASGGIPARASGKAGKAEDVERMHISSQTGGSGEGTITSTGTYLTVFNPFSTAVAGDTYITCKRVDGVWIVDAEDCS